MLLNLINRTASGTGTSAKLMSTMAEHAGILELRQYTMKPEGIKDFLKLTEAHIELRKELLPFLGMFACDTGGVLNRVVHLYNYKDYDQRDKCRKAAGSSHVWQNEYLVNSRKCLNHQESEVYRPAAAALQAAQAAPVEQYFSPKMSTGAPPPVYEMRRYHLLPGERHTQQFLAALEYRAATLSSLGDGQLVFAGKSELGASNSAVEMWRYPSAQASARTGQVATTLSSWKTWDDAMASCIQDFTVSYMQPVSFSPMQ